MKTNSKKKILVSTLALAMGAGLAGSISGSVAWYQYSTKAAVGFTGTSAGTTRNLLVALNETDEHDEYNWQQYINLGTATFRPTSITGTANNLSFYDHPVYQYEELPAASTDGYKKEFEFVFKCEDNGEQVEKAVYLSKLEIVDASNGHDVTNAVRIAIDGNNDFIVSNEGETTNTNGKLDLNGNGSLDTDEWNTLDADEDRQITYKNSEEGLSYDAVKPSDIVVDSSDAYTFGNTTGTDVATTSEDSVSNVVKITIWIEGWEDSLNQQDKTIWDEDYIEQNFEIRLQFACTADR